VIIVELNVATITYNNRKARLVAVNNVTQQVAAEAKLRRSHQWFRYVSKATSDAIYDLDLDTGYLAWGSGLTTLFGYAPQEISMPQWEAHIHPDERDAVLQSFYETVKHTKKKIWKTEYRFLERDGSYR